MLDGEIATAFSWTINLSELNAWTGANLGWRSERSSTGENLELAPLFSPLQLRLKRERGGNCWTIEKLLCAKGGVDDELDEVNDECVLPVRMTVPQD